MKVRCTICERVFEIADAEMGPGGAKVACPSCETVAVYRPEHAVGGPTRLTVPAEPVPTEEPRPAEPVVAEAPPATPAPEPPSKTPSYRVEAPSRPASGPSVSASGIKILAGVIAAALIVAVILFMSGGKKAAPPADPNEEVREIADETPSLPDDPKDLLIRARDVERQGTDDALREAEALYKKAAEKDASLVDAKARIAAIHLWQGLDAQREELIVSGCRETDDLGDDASRSVALSKALCKYALQEFDAALDAAHAAAKMTEEEEGTEDAWRDRRRAEAMLVSALVYDARKDKKAVAEAYKSAVALDPGNIRTRLAAGAYYARNKKMG
ncbi:MAG: zinc-ribbon domain-containing protein [Deltaproteobacteria bacterium]|nr:zinc-ribbon domain-containing protein [Deltaproteobacteria bacterium]